MSPEMCLQCAEEDDKVAGMTTFNELTPQQIKAITGLLTGQEVNELTPILKDYIGGTKKPFEDYLQAMADKYLDQAKALIAANTLGEIKKPNLGFAAQQKAKILDLQSKLKKSYIVCESRIELDDYHYISVGFYDVGLYSFSSLDDARKAAKFKQKSILNEFCLSDFNMAHDPERYPLVSVFAADTGYEPDSLYEVPIQDYILWLREHGYNWQEHVPEVVIIKEVYLT